MSRSFAEAVAALLLAACTVSCVGKNPDYVEPTETGRETEDPSSTAPTGSTTAPTSSSGTITTTSTSTSTTTLPSTDSSVTITTTGMTTAGPGTSSTGPPGTTGMDPIFGCDAYEQDECPPGHKCVPIELDDMIEVLQTPWDTTVCVPYDPDGLPAGDDSCVLNAETGVDDCDKFTYCLFGVCTPLCWGSKEAPMCDFGDACAPLNNMPPVEAGLCFNTCNWVNGETCGFMKTCIPIDDLNYMVCVPQKADAVFMQECFDVTDCADGFLCQHAEKLPGCQYAACCTTYCNLDAPECDQGLECLSVFDNPPMDPDPYWNVGHCVAP